MRVVSALSMHIKLVKFGPGACRPLRVRVGTEGRRQTSGAAEVDASRQRLPPRFDPPLDPFMHYTVHGLSICCAAPALVQSVQSIGLAAVMSCHRRSARVYSVCLRYRDSGKNNVASIYLRRLCFAQNMNKSTHTHTRPRIPVDFGARAGGSGSQFYRPGRPRPALSLRAPQPCSWEMEASNRPRPKHWTNEMVPFFFAFHSCSFILSFSFFLLVLRAYLRSSRARILYDVMHRQGNPCCGFAPWSWWKIWL